MKPEPFLGDNKTLRDRARLHMENGAVTPGYRANQTTVIKLLNESFYGTRLCIALQAAPLYGLGAECPRHSPGIPRARE